jgi:hypothetical protein
LLDAVEVLRFGTKSPPRVLVRFAGAEHEGREEWVPSGRLKVPWSDRAAFENCEQRWARAGDAAKRRGTPADSALSLVFDSLPDWEFAAYAYNNDTGSCAFRTSTGC